jgi:hypothetical protein
MAYKSFDDSSSILTADEREILKSLFRDSFMKVAEQFRLPRERVMLRGFRQSRLLRGVRRPGRWATRKYGA